MPPPSTQPSAESDPAAAITAPLPEAGSSRRKWRAWLRLVVSLALLAIIVAKIEFRPILDALRGARVELLLLVLAMEMGQRIFAAFRWYLLMRSAGSNVTFATAVRICFVAGFVGQFLPGMVGVEAVRVFAMSKSGSNMVDSASSVIVDRLAALFALMIMVIISLQLSNAPFDSSMAIAVTVALGVLILGTAALLWPGLHDPLRRHLPRALAARLDHSLHRLAKALRAYRHRRAALAWALVLAALFQVTRVAAHIVAGWSVGLDAPVVYYFVFIPLVVFCAMLPISFGGLGVVQLGIVYLFASHGMNAGNAMAMSLVILAATLMTTLPGAYLYAARGTQLATRKR